MDPRFPHALRGIGLMVLATATFGFLDSTSKYLSDHYPAPAVVWQRFVLQTLVMMAIFMPGMGLSLVKTGSFGLQVLRGLCLACSSVAFVIALRYMHLAVVTSIVFIAPILVALAGAPLLGERAGLRTWLALAGGFTGVLLIVRPGGAAFGWHVFLPLFCALGVATYQLLTRKLAGHANPITMLFYPGVIAIVLIPIAFPGDFVVLPKALPHALALVAIGILGAVGHFLLIRAHAHAPATLLSPFGYTQLVVALLLGWLLFGQLPDGLALAGIALIAASGLGLVLASRPPRPRPPASPPSASVGGPG
ncbi:MAG: DMT family transporter [Betaproteobacteria bacterium]